MNWINEPSTWQADGDTIRVTTGQDTDFWRVTYYDFIHDNGHFYYQTAQGDFTAEVYVEGDYNEPYDQAMSV
jgi:regulation of enolase protein 1 (concanavalin A-like superfamily)